MLRRILITSTLFLLPLTLSWAQSPQASISGIVTDAQNAVVPQVSVSAVNTETGARTTAVTSASGFYSLQSLAVGPYTVRVEHPGFQAQVQTGIVLTTGQTLQLDIALKVGSVSEAVSVTADAPLIETRSSGDTQLIESKTIEDIPLGDRRALNVMEIQGAAVFVSYASGERPYFSVGGGRARSQNFVFDGGNGQTIRLGQAQVEVDPPVETLQEMRVLTNGFSAEYGGTASGVVIMNTKSGTNQRHGTLWEYIRNEKMDAANFFSPWVDGQKERAPIRYNVFGGTTGGPIRRNKAFYFFGYEGSRRRDGATTVLTVPSLLERSGDFSQTYNANGTLAVIYDPTTGTAATRTPFPGNRIPTARLDPVALNVLKAYPLPNRQPDNIAGANNFAANSVNALNSDVVTAKADYSFTDAQRISFRSLWNRQKSNIRSVYGEPAADPTVNRDLSGWNLLGTWTSILRPTLINELRLGFVTRSTLAFTTGVGQHMPSKLGLQGIPDDAYPRFNINGYTALGSTNQYRNQAPIQQPAFSDTISWIKGSHSVRLGGEARLSRNVDERRQLASGSFTFARASTGLTGRATTGNGISALLLGSPSAFQAARPPVMDRRAWYIAGFIQDDWQVSRTLVLNLGVRWEMDTPFTTQGNYLNGFDPYTINPVSGTPGVVKFAGVNGFPVSPHNTDWNNFAPRVGLAWKPFGSTRTVVRTGFGVYFAAPYDGADAGNAAVLGYGTSLVIPTSDNGATIPFTLSQPIPVQVVNNTLDDRYGAVPVGTQPNTAVTFFDRNRATGYSMQTNFNVQREVAQSMMVSVGYLGNLQRKMPGDPLSLNQISPSLLGPTSVQANRPFPQFSDVQLLAPPIGITNYHAMVTKVEKRFSHGFNLLATYTYSKALSNTTQLQSLGNVVNAYSNAYDRRADYGPSENDIRHRITWTSVYQIPFGRGRRFGSNSLSGRILGNWSISSVLLWQTAPPITVTTSTNTTQAFSAGPQRADVIRNPNLPDAQRSVSRWFDTEAFVQPAANQFGNQGVNITRAAGRTTLNTGVLRDFPVREGFRFQLRGEAFNIFNHTNFGLPGQTLGASAFGVINSAAPPRQLQIGLRAIF